MRSIKESSDELNPPVITAGGFISLASSKRTASDYFALAVATCGVGYLPVAPGTWGSAVGVVLYITVRAANVRIVTAYPQNHLPIELVELLRAAFMLGIICCVTLAGIRAATRAEKLLGRKDPGAVVIDEVAGQLIAFLFIPLGVSLKWWAILAGFLLFRLFDIWKPYPVRRLEALESGLGIMADDVLAGLYAATVLTLLLTLIYYVPILF